MFAPKHEILPVHFRGVQHKLKIHWKLRATREDQRQRIAASRWCSPCPAFD